MVMAGGQDRGRGCGPDAPKGIGTPSGLAGPVPFALPQRVQPSIKPLHVWWLAALGRSTSGLEAQHSERYLQSEPLSACRPRNHLLHPFLEGVLITGGDREVGGRKEGDAWMVGRHPLVWWRNGRLDQHAGEQEK